MFLTRYAVSVFAALATQAVAAPPDAPHATIVTCTNRASGAAWHINIDFDHATVDANPARISAAEIAWQDTKDLWNYKLDRRSGELTIIVASSTGGYFLHGDCKLPP